MARVRFVVLVTLAVAACRPEPPPVAFVTDRFEIAPEFDGELCGGTVAFMEARLAALEALLEVEVEGKIRYNWIEDVSGFCPEGADACVLGTTIYGPWRHFEHELVHAVAGATLGKAKPFLVEGLAEAFSEPMFALEEPMPSRWIDVAPLDVDDGTQQEFYGTAGGFVRFLYEEYGAGRLTRLYRASEYDDSGAVFRAQFEAVYGLSFDEVESIYLDTRKDAYPSVFGCPAPSMAWDGAAYVEDVELECGHPEVLRVDATRMSRAVTLKLDAPAFGAITLDGDDVSLPRYCVPAPFDREGAWVHRRLDAGWHTVTIDGEIDAPRTVRAEFRPE